jgi:hypothetical protein
MALNPIVEGATSDASDLNQVVNLLNGTTTNTPVTVNGPIGARLTGTSAYMRYVGGIPTPPPTSATDNATLLGTFPSSFPLSVPVNYLASGAPFYGSADVAWAPGGPLVLGAAAGLSSSVGPLDNNSSPVATGTGGYACRVHQSAAVTISSAFQSVTCDTVDYDPRGMVQPSSIGPGIAITLPFFGVWGFACAIHGSGVNSMNGPWTLILGNLSGVGFASPCPTYVNSNSSKYTGTSWTGFAIAGGPGVGSGAGGGMDQVSFSFGDNTPPPTNFNLDVSGPDRTYIAVWLVG